ncbi:MAG: LysM peptidoglycan-binding domain-containing protein [Herminiimonas sp.]|nr:LysM peptidoglycan-binding domain-containing protein [Herminiimonas sp.]
MQATFSRTAGLRLKTLTAAVLTALVTVNAGAVGLGKLTVLSGLGQPLRAEIELTSVTPEEARTLQPKLASVDAFRQANIEFNSTLQTLRFAIEQRGGRQFIRITSPQPISEPFVDVLLELNSVNGRLVREYTMLLDPPELRAVQPAQVAPIAAAPVVAATQAPAAAPVPAAPPVADTAAASASAAAAARREAAARAAAADKPAKPAPLAREKTTVAARAPNGNSPGSEYQVKNGDSLSKIATRAKPEGISLDQMLVALYRANPDAFVGNNMNRLRAGQILTIPAGEASAAVGAPEAHGIVVAQAANFSDYRNKLAGQVASGSAQKAGAGRQSASGKIAARVDERPTAASESPDKLKLSKADSAAAGKTAAAQEEKIAREKATAESASRVKDLEKNVNDLQKLLEVKNKDLADRQKNADAVKAPVTASPETAATATPAAATAKPAVAVKPEAVAPAAPVPPVPTPAPIVAVVATTAPAAAVEPVGKPVAKSVVKPKTAKAAAPAPEPALYEEPLVQGGAGLLALLLGGLLFMRARGRKKAAVFPNTTAPADSGVKTNNSLFGSTGGQSVDTNNSVFNSGFVPSAGSLDSNEVDPVAEADVYIAYGRDVQAEEILKEALRTHPERHAVRVKLLEIYASRKDTRAFESVATELYSLCKGEGDDWGQAASMGLALDPANPLYAGGSTTPAPTAHETALLAPAPGLDDNADLDAFLEEVSAAHPFAQTDVRGHAAEVTSAKAVDAPEPLAGNLMDFNAAITPAPSASATPMTPVAPVAPVADNSLDFDLDGLNFDSIARLPEEGSATAPAVASAAPPASIEMPLAASDFDFLNDMPTNSPAAPAVFTEPVALNGFNLAPADIASVQMPVPAPSTPTLSPAIEPMAATQPVPARPDPLEFDLSGITLDLPGSDPYATPAPAERMGHAGSGNNRMQDDFTELDLDVATRDDGASLGGISNTAEMATKLDLAVAYQEIGDHEGARELLDEVLKGGSSEQSGKARSLLAKLS